MSIPKLNGKIVYKLNKSWGHLSGLKKSVERGKYCFFCGEYAILKLCRGKVEKSYLVIETCRHCFYAMPQIEERRGGHKLWL